MNNVSNNTPAIEVHASSRPRSSQQNGHTSGHEFRRHDGAMSQLTSNCSPPCPASLVFPTKISTPPTHHHAMDTPKLVLNDSSSSLAFVQSHRKCEALDVRKDGYHTAVRAHLTKIQHSKE